jgi:hypothetical protein
MNEPTDIQTIMQDGKPAFVVIRFDEYVRLFPKAPRIPQGDAIPHEVVGLTVKKGYTLVRAWREYLRLTFAFPIFHCLDDAGQPNLSARHQYASAIRGR